MKNKNNKNNDLKKWKSVFNEINFDETDKIFKDISKNTFKIIGVNLISDDLKSDIKNKIL